MPQPRKSNTGAAVCTACGEEKDVSEYKPRRRKDGSVTWSQPCRPCREADTRRWQLENVDRCREHNRRADAKRMSPLKEILREAKSQPCVDCGVQLQWQCMDLDHVRGKKVRTIGNASGFGIETLRAEIAKCDVRCPNCHRLRHWRDAQGEDDQEA